MIEYTPWYTPSVQMQVCGVCGACVLDTHTDKHTEWHQR